MATTEAGSFLVAAGINNNGQIAGSYFPQGPAPNLGGPQQGFLLNTDFYVSTFPLSTEYDAYLSALNDEVQMVGESYFGGTTSGFYIDSQH